MTNFGLSDLLLSQIMDVFNHYPDIEWVKMYGSRAIGSYKKISDIDLAYSAKQDSTGVILEALNQLPTAYRFDLTYYNNIQHDGLKHHIDTVGKRLDFD